MTEIKPFLKWVGGKTRLVKTILSYIPSKIDRYFEPFLGSGSVFFSGQFEKAILSDTNKTLIQTYIDLRDNFDELFNYLESLENKNTSEDYYKLRNEFNELRKNTEKNVYTSALMIYLNKTGFSGLYRENQKGEFNVPYGKYKKINITNKANLKRAKEALKKSKILCRDFNIIKNARTGDFIYLDPPYHKETKTSFTKYQKGDFDKTEQIRLSLLLKKLDKKGVKFLLSNSNTDFIRELYSEFNIVEVTVKRHLNNKNKTSSRQKLNNEVLIFNYTKEIV